MKAITGNPVLEQLHLFKLKIKQQSSLIKSLNSQLQARSRMLETAVSEMQTQFKRVLAKLKALQQINIKYIKNYIEIKKSVHINQLTTTSQLLENDIRLVLVDKFKQVREQLVSNQVKQAQSQIASKTIVSNCHSLMRHYLHQRKVKYEKDLKAANQKLREKMKEAKGLQAYKQSKEESKVVETIKKKIVQFEGQTSKISEHNMMETFTFRQEIEHDLSHINSNQNQLQLEESLDQQKLFMEIIHSVVTTADELGMEQFESFGSGGLSYLENRIRQLSQEYPSELVERQVQMSHLAMKELHKNHPYFTESQIGENRKIAKRRVLKKIKKEGGQQGEQVSEYQQVFEQEEEGGEQNQIVRRGRTKHQRQEGYRSSEESDQQRLGLSSRQERQPRQQSEGQMRLEQSGESRREKAERRKRRKEGQGLLDAKYESVKSQSFYQQQQKKRDQLIAKQNGEIKEHEKVIDKLITFIKKEFKDRKLEDIDGDDPQQLIGYYFKVNEKKHADLNEEMSELKKETTEKEKQLKKVSMQMKEKEIAIQQLSQQIEMQQNEIKHLSAMCEDIKAVTIELNILTTKTENIVKQSLEALIDSYMNKISPEMMIEHLQTIIEMIRTYMNDKKDVTCKMTIQPSGRTLQKTYSVEGPDIQFPQPVQQNVQFKVQQNVQYNVQPAPEPPSGGLNQIIVSTFDFIKSFIQQPPQKKQEAPQKRVEQGDRRKISRQVNEVFTDTFLNTMKEKIQQIRVNQSTGNEDDEMYRKYKQAVDCLQRSQNIIKENEMRFQKFVLQLKRQKAWESPQALEQKLFYMQRVISTQNQLLENQRKEYQQVILKQVNQSEELAQDILRKIKVKRRTTTKQ